MDNMSLSPHATSRKRPSEEDHYDPVHHPTRRAWTVSREVIPSDDTPSAPANPTVHSRPAVLSTTYEPPSSRYAPSSPGCDAEFTDDTDPEGAQESPEYTHTSPQYRPDSDPYTFSPISPAFRPRSVTSILGSPRIGSASPARIPEPAMCSPTSAAYIPDSPKFSPPSPKISTFSPHHGRSPAWSESSHLWQIAPEVLTSPQFTPSSPNLATVSPRHGRRSHWSEARLWQTLPEDSLSSMRYATEGSTPRADRSRTPDLGRPNLPWNETYHVSDPQDGHLPVAPGTSLAYRSPSRQGSWSPSFGAASPDYEPQLHAPFVDPGNPLADVSSLQRYEGCSSDGADTVDHEPQYHGLLSTSGITPAGSTHSLGFNVAYADEADSPGNGLHYNTTPGYRPYFPYHHSQVGMHAFDPPSSRQQTLNEYEELGARSAREENVPPDTPGSSPNNPIVLSPMLGFSGDAAILASNGQTNGARRSEGSTRETPGSSSPSLRNTLTRTPEVAEPPSNVASGLNSVDDDGTEDQSLTHEGQSTTPKAAPTPLLQAEVDKAISLVNKLGDPYLGRAVRKVYQWSKNDPEVAGIMTSVLIETSTVEEQTEFQAMIQYARTHHMDADESMDIPSLAEDVESDNGKTHGSLVGERTSVYSIGEGTSVYSENMEDDDDEYDASTASFPSVPSSPSTVKGDEVRDDLSAETVWGAIAMQYM